MGADVQPFKEITSSVPIMGNGPVTNAPLDEENNDNEINNGNETLNIPPHPNNDIEFDIPYVQVSVSCSDEEDYYTINTQEMEHEPDPNDLDLPATLMVRYFGNVNVHADEVNG